MNNKRRTEISHLIKKLEDVSERLQYLSDEEQDCLDNMPENLLESDRCLQMEENVDKLNDLSQDVDSVIDEMQELIS